MPRVGRVVPPNYPHHVVQRGHNRQAVFAKAADDRSYLALDAFKTVYDVNLFTCCR